MKPTLLCALFLCGGCHFELHNSADLGDADLAVTDANVPLGDMAGGGSGMVCLPNATACAQGALETCRGDGSGVVTTTCPLGCGSSGGVAHCQQLYPSAPVNAGGANDLDATGVDAPVTLGATTVVFDTATGAIDDVTGATSLRAANPVANTHAVDHHIAFRRSDNGVAIWTFAGLTISPTTTVIFQGAASVALVSLADMSIGGVVDARGYGPAPARTLCLDNVAGPGGFAGGQASALVDGSGSGGGKGAAAANVAGGGGAGFAATGGKGGDNQANAGGGGGGVYGADNSLTPIGGGSGGGAGGSAGGGGTVGGSGGGGGGGVQLVALGVVTIDGSSSTKRGGVDVAGCGGHVGSGGTPVGGGGGGSGGAILIEAPSVIIKPNGGLAANGGAGAGANSNDGTKDGKPGALDGNHATGGGATPSGSGGGDGGATGLLGGVAATTGQAGGGGGGGGSSGRIRIKTANMAGLTLQTGALLSPGFGDQSMTAATQGAVDIH